MRPFLTRFVAIGLAACSLAHGAQPAAELEEVQVVATRLPAPPGEGIRDVAILEADSLARHADLGSALAELPGVHVQRTGGRSGFNAAFVDGGDPNFTVVMVDGVALNNPLNTRGGAVDLSSLETGGFLRAEVAAGSFSSVHGSGALAGAVNLVVPGGLADLTARGSVALGSRDDRHAVLQLRGPLAAGLGASFSADIADEGITEGGASYRSQSYMAKLAALDAGEDRSGSLLLRVRSSEGLNFPDASGGDRYAMTRTLEHRGNRQSLAAAQLPLALPRQIQLRFIASWFEDDTSTITPGVAPSGIDPFGLPAGSDHSRYDSRNFEVHLRTGAPPRRLLLGAARQWERGRSEGLLDFGGFQLPNEFLLERATSSFFGEARLEGSRWAGSLSSRLDKVEGLRAQLTASAGLRRSLPELGLTLRSSIGTAFKAPSLYALGNPFVGNPDLKPESARGWRASAEWEGSAGTQVRLAAFGTRYSGLIDFVPGPPPRLENRDVVRSRGATLDAKQRIGTAVSLMAFMQQVDTIDIGSGERLLDRPGWRAGAGLEWRAHPRLAITLRHSHVGRRLGYSIPTGTVSLRGFDDLNLDIAWRATDRYWWRLRVDNATQAGYEHAVGFTAPSRRVQLLLSREP